MTTDRSEFHCDILDGLAAYFASPFVADILATVTRFPEPDLGNALNRNQVAGKLWLADSLRQAAGSEYGTVTVLGGWFGVLGAILLHDLRLSILRVVSVDIDPRCNPVALSLNATHVRSGRFAAVTGDMFELDYRTARDTTDVGARHPTAGDAPASGSRSRPDLLINTACEHIAGFADWYARVPAGQLLVLQSNDYAAIPEHVNCVPDLDAFRAQAPMACELFGGVRQHKRFRRFMLIGRK